MPCLPRTPSLRLDGKQALVSGGGRGIGLAAAAALADAGAEVVLVARSAPELERAAALIGAGGGTARFLATDVTNPANFPALDPYGPFDILVNAAGASLARPFVEVSPEAFDALFDLNLRAAFFLTQYVVQGLAAAGRRGSIINVSSTLGQVGLAGRSVYSASKFGLEGFTKSLALELGPIGIRVNSLCPTVIETDMVRTLLEDPGYREMVFSKIKVGRLGRLEDLMGAFLFLASDASALMTGSALVIDGGWTAE